MSEKFELIAAEAGQPTAPTISSMCTALQVSRSGYYDWVKAVPSARARRRHLVTGYVTAAFTFGRGTYGVRRVHAVVARSADPQVASASVDLVRDIMRENALVACQPRGYRTTTQQGDHPFPIPDRDSGTGAR